MKTTQTQPVWAIGVFVLLLYVLCLVWQNFITDPALQTLHVQLLMLTFPGFSGMTLGSMLWGAVLSFVYAVGGVWLYRLTLKSCCK